MGTEAFWVPAALAAVSTGANYANQRNAANRQDQAEATAIRNQDAIRQQGVGQVQKTIQAIAGDSPTQLAGKATGDYVSQLRRNAAGATQGGSTTGGTQTFGQSTSALAPDVVGSKEYQNDKASAQKQVSDYGNTYAGEMGTLDAATRMRQNEGLLQENLGTGLNVLGAKSFGQNFVDQLRAQTAGQANPWVSLFANMLGNGAKAYAMNNANPSDTVSKYARILGNGYTAGGSPVDAGSGLTGATGVYA